MSKPKGNRSDSRYVAAKIRRSLAARQKTQALAGARGYVIRKRRVGRWTVYDVFDRAGNKITERASWADATDWITRAIPR